MLQNLVRQLLSVLQTGAFPATGNGTSGHGSPRPLPQRQLDHLAFRAAWLRRKKVTSVDKANILETSILWRHVVTGVSQQYPEVTLEHMLVDTAAMQLVLRPSQFDIVLCESTFGDILGDEAAALVGSVGMLPTASLAAPHQGLSFGLFAPAGGSAPDIAGKNLANPIGQILAAALMLRYSFGLHLVAKSIENAVDQVIADGVRTADIQGAGDSMRPATTSAMGDAIAKALSVSTEKTNRQERPVSGKAKA